MPSSVYCLFHDSAWIQRIQERLPVLFQMAEIASSRAGKIGMEVGSLRERIIIALLSCYFGDDNTETDIPITMPEIDVNVLGQDLSIKTLSGKYYTGLKLSWTVDEESARNFHEQYEPRCDILFIRIFWGGIGEFSILPLEAQLAVFEELGVRAYLKLPKPGTNPRGVEMSKLALQKLVHHNKSLKIDICWDKKALIYDPAEQWKKYWSADNVNIL